MEYFTRWIEAEHVVVISAAKVQHFVWKNIVCRFGVLRVLIYNNGTQFASKQLREICQELKIKQVFSSVEYPQTNSQGEATNRVILRGIKGRLHATKKGWFSEVSQVLLSYHTTPQSTTTKNPFSLVYGTYALILIETVEPTYRVINFSPRVLNEIGRADLDLLEKVRECV